MKHKGKKNNTKEKKELWRRILFTLFILAVYMGGRTLLITGIDVDACGAEAADAQSILAAMVTGGRANYTVLALGIMPGMFGQFITMLVMGIINLFRKARFSMRNVQRITLVITIAVALIMAMPKASGYVFVDSLIGDVWLQRLAILELVAGAVFIYQLVQTNTKHGIAGMSPIILYNMVSMLVPTIRSHTFEDLKFPILLGVGLAVIMLLMDNIIIRIPVQRVSIHNIYADKDYIALKFNPVGFMPVMFAMIVFMVPQMLVKLLLVFKPENELLQMLSENMTTQHPIGIYVYMAIIIILTLIFAIITLNPGDIADSLQRGGDSIVGVYAGKKTARYLWVRVLGFSAISGVIMALSIGGCLMLAARGVFESDLSMVPTMFMGLAGIMCMVIREFVMYVRLDSYKFLF